MLHVIHPDDLKVYGFIQANDPFYLGTLPCWMSRVWPLLPPEVVKISVEELNRMPIKVVEEKEAPARAHKRGVVSGTKDYNEVMQALRLPAKPGSAMVVTMTESEWATVKKPEVSFAYSLRRYFESKGLALTAYQSGKLEVTIRKATALDGHKAKK
jgi:hypothetical protein